MSNFHDVLFPLDIALNAEGGPVRRTDIVSLVSGHEERNSPWAGSRRRFNAGYGVKSLSDIERVIAFFEARHGRLYGFRFRDPFDHKSCAADQQPTPTDQQLADGDGAATNFDLEKTYESGGWTYARRITKPAAGSVIAAIDGVETNAFTVDADQGRVLFDTAPPAGAVITVGFVFDVPVRFDADSLQINLASFRAGDIPSIPMVEVLS